MPRGMNKMDRYKVKVSTREVQRLMSKVDREVNYLEVVLTDKQGFCFVSKKRLTIMRIEECAMEDLSVWETAEKLKRKKSGVYLTAKENDITLAQRQMPLEKADKRDKIIYDLSLEGLTV